MLQSLPETGTLRVDDLISDAGTSEAQAGAATPTGRWWAIYGGSGDTQGIGFCVVMEHIWVCLKIGCTSNYSHLIGIMIINHWVYGYTIFRQTHIVVSWCQSATCWICFLNLFLDKSPFSDGQLWKFSRYLCQRRRTNITSQRKNSHSKNTQQTSRAQSHMLGVLTYPN